MWVKLGGIVEWERGSGLDGPGMGKGNQGQGVDLISAESPGVGFPRMVFMLFQSRCA